MITRRQFLKTSGLLGLYLMLPSFLGEKNARSAILDNINYVPPSVMPQVINIFLYGGPSELAGNLTNIEDINANSQNAYPSSLDPSNVDNDITPNNFWGAAGGWAMEDLLANGDMSVYRTINRLKDDSKAHGRSITQNLVGNLDLFFSGIATTLAAILATFNPFDKEINELILPFVSFEGESVAFNLGDLEIPQVLRPVTIGSNLQNPYQRKHSRFQPRDPQAIIKSMKLLRKGPILRIILSKLSIPILFMRICPSIRTQTYRFSTRIQVLVRSYWGRLVWP
jgi:hypothetical protein